MWLEPPLLYKMCVIWNWNSPLILECAKKYNLFAYNHTTLRGCVAMVLPPSARWPLSIQPFDIYNWLTITIRDQLSHVYQSYKYVIYSKYLFDNIWKFLSNQMNILWVWNLIYRSTHFLKIFWTIFSSPSQDEITKGTDYSKLKKL